MREILFRGKRKDNGEWVFGFLHKMDGYGTGYTEYGIQIQDTSTSRPWSVLVIPETVGQFTGLTDINNRKIFEGAIVRFGRNIYQIAFTGGSFVLYDIQGKMISKIGGNNDHCYSLMDLYVECCWEDNWAYDIEVIGNIHDNPELFSNLQSSKQ